MIGRSWAAVTLWVLGYPDQALQWSHEALIVAQQRSYPFSLAFALYFVTWLHQCRREEHETQERTEDLMVLATEQGYPLFSAAGTVWYGWALARQGQEEGIAQMQQGLQAYRNTGAEQKRTYFLALLAEAYGKRGQIEEGLTVLAEALTLVDKQGVRFYEAEIHRLKGELLLSQSPDNQTEAETCFQQALSIARNQQAKSWELRCASDRHA